MAQLNNNPADPFNDPVIANFLIPFLRKGLERQNAGMGEMGQDVDPIAPTSANATPPKAPGAAGTPPTGAAIPPNIYSPDFTVPNAKPDRMGAALSALKGANFGPGAPVMKGYGPTWGQNFLTGLAKGAGNVGDYMQKEDSENRRFQNQAAIARFRGMGKAKSPLEEENIRSQIKARDAGVEIKRKAGESLEAYRQRLIDNGADRNDLGWYNADIHNQQGQSRIDQGDRRLGIVESQGNERLDQGWSRIDQGDRRLDTSEEQGNRRLDQGDTRNQQGQSRIDEQKRMNDAKLPEIQARTKATLDRIANPSAKNVPSLTELDKYLASTEADIKALEEKKPLGNTDWFGDKRTEGEEQELTRLRGLHGAIKSKMEERATQSPSRGSLGPSSPAPGPINANGSMGAQTKIINGKLYTKVQGGWQLSPQQ